ncbi:MAG: hypothetical protein IJJ70_00590 [Treponema sp.]|nr:hypothetical protein [bacterium]MBQ6058331.1 hypothetical protein [Treponema sp.]MBR0486188.1 hypothetical protein [Treponema sp.]
MKLSKVLLGSLFAAAMLGLFAGCAEEEDANDMLKVSGSKCTIDYTNESTTDYSRGFESLKTKHYDAVCKISNETTANKVNGDGVMGYIFAINQNDDKTYNFGLAGVRNNNGTVEAYVSYFSNVGAKYLNSGNNFSDINGVKIGDTGCLATEHDITKEAMGTTSSWKTLETYAGKTFEVWINVVANDGTSTGRTGDAGSYTVSFYDSDPLRTTSAIGSNTTYGEGAPSAIASYTVPASDTGLTAMTKLDLGFYANVYGSSTLKGTWELSDIEGEGEPVEYED